MLNHKIKTLLVFFITLLTLVVYYLRFSYNWYNQKLEYYNLIERVNNTPFNLLQQDLSKIFNLMNSYGKKQTVNHLDKEIIQLNIIKNFIIKSNDAELRENGFKPKVSKDILEISIGKTITYIDLQSLKTLIQNLIPEYIVYNIYLNDQLVISNGNSSYLKETQESKLTLSAVLVREISIKSSFLHQEKKRLLFRSAIDYIAVIIPCVFISVFLYRKINHQLNKELKTSYRNFSHLKRYNELLDHKLTREKEYTSMIMQKINNKTKNELLVKLTGAEKNGQSSANFVTFPFAIIDNTKSTINIKKLLADLVSFFKYNLEQKKIEVIINTKIDYIEINASEESLYQIIFSLVFNVLNLIPDQTKLIISAENEAIFKFTLEYSGFNLSEEQMRNYTSRHPKEVFLLNLNQVFDHLKLYNFSYSIEKDKINHMIRLQICSDKIIKEKDKNKIFKLKDYRKK
jgi:hypothetical protein